MYVIRSLIRKNTGSSLQPNYKILHITSTCEIKCMKYGHKIRREATAFAPVSNANHEVQTLASAIPNHSAAVTLVR